jgi:hypothetical protein
MTLVSTVELQRLRVVRAAAKTKIESPEVRRRTALRDVAAHVVATTADTLLCECIDVIDDSTIIRWGTNPRAVVFWALRHATTASYAEMTDAMGVQTPGHRHVSIVQQRYDNDPAMRERLRQILDYTHGYVRRAHPILYKTPVLVAAE